MTVVFRALYGSADAAAYLGVSETRLRELDIRRRVLGARRLYDRRDLDAFVDALPYEGEPEQGGPDAGENTCDAAFGGVG